MTTPPSSRGSSLLSQIEHDALDSSLPLADVLLKCVALGGHTGSSALRDWAKRELDGYPTEEDVPDYRVITATLWMRHTNRAGYNPLTQQISPQALPKGIREHFAEEIRLTDPLSQLEALSKRDEPLTVTRSSAQDLAQLMTQQGWEDGRIPRNQIISDIYWQMEPIAIGSVVSRIRAALVSFVAEVVAAMPPGEQVPSAAATDKALKLAVPGIHISDSPHAVVNVNHGSSGGITNTVTTGGEAKQSRFWPVTGWIVGTLVAIASLYAALGQWLDWPNPWQ
ncbi:hypothetical protein ACFV1N_08760 [Streptosporangium canum]|uniref:AbiTii domain-containing protein n=1 Tax=Streptosporangium canum TaxID=324952 RepID=UPI0036C507D9